MFCGSLFKVLYFFVKCDAFILKRESSRKKRWCVGSTEEEHDGEKGSSKQKKVRHTIAIITSLIET